MAKSDTSSVAHLHILETRFDCNMPVEAGGGGLLSPEEFRRTRRATMHSLPFAYARPIAGASTKPGSAQQKAAKQAQQCNNNGEENKHYRVETMMLSRMLNYHCFGHCSRRPGEGGVLICCWP